MRPKSSFLPQGVEIFMKIPQIACDKCGVYNSAKDVNCWKCNTPISVEKIKSIQEDFALELPEKEGDAFGAGVQENKTEGITSKSIIKAGLILIGIVLLIIVGFDWYAFNSDLNALKDSPLGGLAMRIGEEKISEMKTTLVIKTVIAFALIFFGTLIQEKKS